MIGLQVVVDGSGLERPRAGVGVYTAQILHAMHVDRPDCRMTVFGPPGAFVHVPDAGYRLMPRTRLIGRHLQWPARIRQLKPDAYFGPAGVLPLGDVGCPSVITVHDLAIYRNSGWFPGRQPLSTRYVVPRSVLRADVVIAVSENTARDVVDVFGIPRSRIDVVPHGVAAGFTPMSAEDLAAAEAAISLLREKAYEFITASARTFHPVRGNHRATQEPRDAAGGMGDDARPARPGCGRRVGLALRADA